MAGKADIDLDALSVQQLTTLIQDAETKRREKLEDAKAQLLADMEQRAAEMGLTLEAVLDHQASPAPAPRSGGRRVRKDAGSQVAAKFRGPNGEEWSGRGRPPSWLTALEADGKNREEFRL